MKRKQKHNTPSIFNAESDVIIDKIVVASKKPSEIDGYLRDHGFLIVSRPPGGHPNIWRLGKLEYTEDQAIKMCESGAVQRVREKPAAKK